jgi:HAD superfamily hydrolase (TIGR01549 family)
MEMSGKMRRIFTTEHKKVIFFDMNRTLIDPQQSLRDSFIETLQDYTARWEPNDSFTPEHIMQTYLDQWKKQKRAKGNATLSLEQIRRKCLAQALQRLPFPIKDSFIRTFWQQTRARQQESPRLFPQVRETLEQLAAKPYRLAIISNGSKTKQEKQLKLLNLQSLIPSEHLFSSKNGGIRKPNPLLFKQALLTMGIPAAQAVMVGDSWKNDITGAISSGIDAIWLHAATAEPKQSSQRMLGNRKVIIIRDFEQLKSLF